MEKASEGIQHVVETAYNIFKMEISEIKILHLLFISLVLHLLLILLILQLLFMTLILHFLFMSLGRKVMFYLTMQSTHFIYGYMVSDIC